jgi:uncharacterized membrane protein
MSPMHDSDPPSDSPSDPPSDPPPDRPRDPLRDPGSGPPPSQGLSLDDLPRVAEHLAERLEMAGGARLHRQAKAEPRWPVSLSVIIAITLQLVVSGKLALQPRFVLPGLEVALLIGLNVANPLRIERASRPVRTASIMLIVLISAANAASAALLVKVIVTGQPPLNAYRAPVALLGTGAAIWATNVIAFALWYWEFDRGGPVQRLHGKKSCPDLLFPQMTVPRLTPRGWGPQFVDYLYMSFTNATAFSPTDVMPLARWAKLTMLVQSAVSLSLGALVIARAVNILR